MFLKAKQWAAQKLGKADSSAETAEFLESLENLKAIADSFTALNKVAKSLLSADPTQPNTADNFLSTEIKPALKLKANYDGLKFNFDAASTDFKKAEAKGDAKKMQAARAKMDEAKAAYEAARDQLKNAIDDLDRKKSEQYTSSINTLCQVLQALTPDWGEQLPPIAGGGVRKPTGATPVQSGDKLVSSVSASAGVPESSAAFSAPAAASSAASSGQKVMIAQFEHEGDPAENELTLAVGDKIYVIDDSQEGWWTGRKEDGTEGLFPVPYCKFLE